MSGLDEFTSGIDEYKKDDTIIDNIHTIQSEFHETHKDMYGEDMVVDLTILLFGFIKIPIKGTIRRRGLPLAAFLEYAKSLKHWNKEAKKNGARKT